MDLPKPVPLRSPRELLGGYILFPRLIDKVRLLAQGQLPQAYAANVLGTEFTLDGRFLAFTGLDAEALRRVILSNHTDDEVLAWVPEHARPTTAWNNECGPNRLIAIGPMWRERNIGSASTQNSRHKSRSVRSAYWI